MLSAEEKIVLLGGLFHDVGKFSQRCGVKSNSKHDEIGSQFVAEEIKNKLFKEIVGADNVKKLQDSIGLHHSGNRKEDYIRIIQDADYLSAGERVEKDITDFTKGEMWSHKFLSSPFSKLQLNNLETIAPRYYKHELLNKTNYDVLLPKYDSEESIKEDNAKYNQEIWKEFTEDVKTALELYKGEEHFNTVINVLLMIFEKYMWCIPDFTGNKETDISLYNHLKDVAAFAHAIYKTKQVNEDSSRLRLIIGDIPGIQKYIFDMVYKHPAKILRGRSAFIQILGRQFSTIFLEELGLTDCSLIMQAGGKFYILAHDGPEVDDAVNRATEKIEEYLINNFDMRLKFASSYATFNYNDLINKKGTEKDKDQKEKITFGDIINLANGNLLKGRKKLFHRHFFKDGVPVEDNQASKEKFIDKTGDDIKCAVTEYPVRNGRDKIEILKEDKDKEKEKVQIDEQVYQELLVGRDLVKDNTVVVFDKKVPLMVKKVKKVGAWINEFAEHPKLIINPLSSALLDSKAGLTGSIYNTYFLEIANHVQMDSKNSVMDFGDIATKHCNGAQYLTLIKGDIDNLGLLLSMGLTRNVNKEESDKDKKCEKDLTAISRTTTISNQLKYFFSFFINGFMEKWYKDGYEILEKNEIPGEKNDQVVYTVFAGGDDLMFIAPQSSAVELVNELNKKFGELVCDNPEIHISWSLTNFKDHTPVRIVADMAERNQKISKGFKDKGKKKTEKEYDKNNHEWFFGQKNKNTLYLFDSVIDNSLIDEFVLERNKLIELTKGENPTVSSELIRNFLQFAEMIGEFDKGNMEKALWHPLLTYKINRLGSKIENPDLKIFCDRILRLNKEDKKSEMKQMLYPLIASVIYYTRKI